MLLTYAALAVVRINHKEIVAEAGVVTNRVVALVHTVICRYTLVDIFRKRSYIQFM